MVNRDNYLLTRAYLAHPRDVGQLARDSTERYRAYLLHLLVWADEAPFSDLAARRPTFPAHLASLAPEGKGGLAPATLRKIVQVSKRFLVWGKMNHPREFRGLSMAWIDELRLSRQAEAPREHVFVTLDEVRRLVALSVPEDHLALRRDQAAAALLFLSGMRAGALGSLPIAAVDAPSRTVKQWPSLGVRTKNGKPATTYLLEIPDLLAVVERWDALVRAALPPTAPWAATVVTRWGEQALSADPAGAHRNVALVKRMGKLFAAAGLPYKSPHKFRHGHAVYALQHARTMADYKAVSQNLMHADIRVTDGIYAPLLGDEVKRRIAVLGDAPAKDASVTGGLAQSLRGLSPAELAEALHLIAEQMAG